MLPVRPVLQARPMRSRSLIQTPTLTKLILHFPVTPVLPLWINSRFCWNSILELVDLVTIPSLQLLLVISGFSHPLVRNYLMKLKTWTLLVLLVSGFVRVRFPEPIRSSPLPGGMRPKLPPPIMSLTGLLGPMAMTLPGTSRIWPEYLPLIQLQTIVTWLQRVEPQPVPDRLEMVSYWTVPMTSWKQSDIREWPEDPQGHWKPGSRWAVLIRHLCHGDKMLSTKNGPGEIKDQEIKELKWMMVAVSRMLRLITTLGAMLPRYFRKTQPTLIA